MTRRLRAAAAAALTAAGLLLSGCGSLPFFSDPWEGTWWGVQNAGTNWSGDEIRNLETFTFTKNGDSITVEHKTQRGGKEIEGSLSGTAREDASSSPRRTAAGKRPSPTAAPAARSKRPSPMQTALRSC